MSSFVVYVMVFWNKAQVYLQLQTVKEKDVPKFI